MVISSYHFRSFYLTFSMYMYVQVCLCTCSACGTIRGMIIVDRVFLVYLSQGDYLHELRGNFFSKA